MSDPSTANLLTRRRQIEAAAHQFQDRPALTANGQTLSYSELIDEVQATANQLRDAGVQPGHGVGVCIGPGIDQVIAMLAPLWVDAYPVPLDPRLPAPRLQWMIEDCQPAVVVADADSRALIGNNALVVSPGRVEGETGAITPAQGGSALPGLGYICYTSGSTGRPKGVLVDEAGVVVLLNGLIEMLGITQDDTILMTTAHSFDVSVVELYMPLMAGGRLVVADADQRRDPEEVAALIQQHGVTIASATPSAWSGIAEALEHRGPQPHLTVLSAGEALPSSLATRLIRISTRVFNAYGPTETTIYSTIGELHVAHDGTVDVSIGRAAPGTTILVLDEERNPVRQGQSGELVIGGAGVARGYLNLPEATRERFVTLPHRHGRWYLSGDRARQRSDGGYDYLGRIDDQLKVRGHRVEPAEIAERLLEHPDVKNAIVIGQLQGDYNMKLVAHVVAAESLDLSVLRQWCAETLPEYCVPSMVIPHEALPLTGSGKIDVPTLRAAVATPAQRRPSPDGEEDAMERAVRGAWRRELWLDDVAGDDDFFELGGDSLAATSVLAELSTLVGMSLPLRTIFVHSTPDALVTALRTAQATGTVPLPDRPKRGAR